MAGIPQNNFHAVSLSRGKDSTAMLLLMIARDMPIDMVLYADTGMEFPEMYDHLAKLDAYLYAQRGIHITVPRHPQGFEYLMFEEPKVKPKSIENRLKLGVPLYGNGRPGIRVRWCTGALKTKLIDKEVKRLKGELGAIHYIGIAYDEVWRCKGERYTLVEWGITEAQALCICYDRGYDFGGLYEIYNRASCWYCPFQRIGELRKLRKHHPELWAKLMELDEQRKFRNFWGSTKAIRRLSDTICIENGYSIVENPKGRGKSYDKWLGSQKQPSHRERIRYSIDDALAQNPQSFEKLLELLQKAGYQVTDGKVPSLLGDGQKRAIRMDTLGAGYTPDDLRAILAGTQPKKDDSRIPPPSPAAVC